jgi:hypothetical protein
MPGSSARQADTKRIIEQVVELSGCGEIEVGVEKEAVLTAISVS